MPRTYAFRTLDVFTSTAYAGNQLGVVTVPKDQPLTQSEKQAIAKEFNLSESIFVHEPPSPPSQAPETPRVEVDIFTTESELPFAGHPTIGAINHILTHVYPGRDEVVVQLKAGPVLGKLDRESGFARAEIPQEFHHHAAKIEWDAVVAAQPSLRGGAQATVDLASIVRGMNFALVDFTSSPELLTKVQTTPVEMVTGEYLDEGWPATLIGSMFYVRGPDKGDGVIRVDQRLMVMGIEDPATGSASCALTALLAVERGGEGVTHRFELVQGEQMGRKSVIGTEVTLDASGKKVEKIVLLGQCKSVMRGELDI